MQGPIEYVRYVPSRAGRCPTTFYQSKHISSIAVVHMHYSQLPTSAMTRRLQVFALVALLCFVCGVIGEKAAPAKVDVASLSTQEIEEQLQVSSSEAIRPLPHGTVGTEAIAAITAVSQ